MADSRGAAQRGVAGGSCAQDQGGRLVGQLRRRGWRRHAARDGRRLDVASRKRGASAVSGATRPRSAADRRLAALARNGGRWFNVLKVRLPGVSCVRICCHVLSIVRCCPPSRRCPGACQSDGRPQLHRPSRRRRCCASPPAPPPAPSRAAEQAHPPFLGETWRAAPAARACTRSVARCWMAARWSSQRSPAGPRSSSMWRPNEATRTPCTLSWPSGTGVTAANASRSCSIRATSSELC